MKLINGYSFPETDAELATWEPTVRLRPLARKVLAVAHTRCEGAWAAYCDAVPGQRHDDEAHGVLDWGAKLPKAYAVVMFPEFAKLTYDE
jgi:hypothetical protein